MMICWSEGDAVSGEVHGDVSSGSRSASAKARGNGRRKVGPALESTCYMAECEGMGLVGCLDASVREGPCASQINGVCVREGVVRRVDNVAVDAGREDAGRRD